MGASPDIENYVIPAAKIYAKLSDDPDYVDMGNLVQFNYTQDVSQKEHFSSQSGLRARDRVDPDTASASIDFIVDEHTARNLSLYLLAEVDTDTDGNEVIYPLSNPTLTADIKVISVNTRGPMRDFYANVTFTPGGALSLMADNNDYGQIPMKAGVNKQDGRFGKFVIRQQA